MEHHESHHHQNLQDWDNEDDEFLTRVSTGWMTTTYGDFVSAEQDQYTRIIEEYPPIYIPTSLQEAEIPQQFADLEEWNEWVVGHFNSNQAQNPEDAAERYLSGRSLTDSAVNLHEHQIYGYANIDDHHARLGRSIEQLALEHSWHLNLQEIEQ